MKIHPCIIPLVFFLSAALPGPASAQLRAFPGAEGYGALASGGRGGDVYIVTNRNDSGAGSFREAFNYSGTTPRTIVFETSGTINLDARLTLNTKSNITIAGHTAPGGGVLIRGDAFSVNNCSNLIIRHMRFRYENADADRDALAMSASTNVILDHVSTSWGRDECLSLTNAVNQITVQNCIIAEATRVDHQYGSLINSTAPNGRITLWRNLYINNAGRTPRAASQNGEDFVFEFKNNVIYNWGVEGDWGSESCVSDNERATWNMVNNLFIAGPDTTKNFFEDLLNRYSSTILRGGSGNDSAYLSGNKVDSDRDGTLDPGEAAWGNVQGDFTQLSEPRTIDAWAEISQVQSPEAALAAIVAGAGAFPWNRDTVDARFIEELESYGSEGNIRTSIPSFPTIATGTAPVDTDRDGMPDTWETWYGIDPAVKTNNLVAPNGYTAIENYLQWIIDPASVSPLPVEEGEGVAEGVPEGVAEGVAEGTTEGAVEGITEGVIEGTIEGIAEGLVEGSVEGTVEGEGISEGVVDGEGAPEGTQDGEGESPYVCMGNLLLAGGFESEDTGTVWGASPGATPEPLLHVDGEFDLPVAEGTRALRFLPRVITNVLSVGQLVSIPVGVQADLTLHLLVPSAATGVVQIVLNEALVQSIQVSGLSPQSTYQPVTIPLPVSQTEAPQLLTISNPSLSGGIVLIDAICLKAVDITEGAVEGVMEGLTEGAADGEGNADGAADGEGASDGEGLVVVEGEGAHEGVMEGEGDATIEGEGQQEGTSEGSAEGRPEGEGVAEGAGDGEGTATEPQTADTDGDLRISLSELLRLIQFYNADEFRCDEESEDGYAPGAGDVIGCPPHQSDYAPRDWSISLGELLRLIQFYSLGGYHPCDSEDGYCPGVSG